MSQIWNADFTKVVPNGASGNQAQYGIFYRNHEGVIRRLTEAEGHKVSYNPETVERNPIGQEAPSTEIRSYHMTLDKDIIIKKGADNYEFFAGLKRLRPTGDNAKLEVHLVDFRMEEIGKDHNRYYAEKMSMTVTINSVNETDGILSVNFAQDGDYTTGVMGRTDDSISDDETTFTYGFTSSRDIDPTSITLSKNTVNIPEGGSARVAVSFSPLGCPYDFTVESGDKEIARVNRWNQSVDISGRSVGSTTITITSTADLTKTAVINVVVGKAFTGIAVTTPPNKVEYEIGEALDLTGLVVTATFSDGSTSVVNANDFTVTGFDSSAEGEITLTVTYNGKSATFTVTIVEI